MNKHEIRIMLREYNEWLVEQCYADSDILNIYDEFPDDQLDTFINNFSLKSKT